MALSVQQFLGLLIFFQMHNSPFTPFLVVSYAPSSNYRNFFIGNFLPDYADKMKIIIVKVFFCKTLALYNSKYNMKL